MKTRLFLIAAALILMACDVTIIEPAYDNRNSITGSYRVDEFSQTYNQHIVYTMFIRKAGFSREVILENFYDVDIDVRATFDYDKLYIYRQKVNGYEIEGVGTIYGSEIKFSYKVRDLYSNDPTDFCNATAWAN